MDIIRQYTILQQAEAAQNRSLNRSGNNGLHS